MATPRVAGQGSSRPGLLKRYLPILQWLPEYQLAWLRADIVPGLAVWAVLVPTSMAYAGIAVILFDLDSKGVRAFWEHQGQLG